MNVQTYLFFNGNCRDAIEFYQRTFNASIECLITYQEGPKELAPPGWSEKIFHSTLKFGDSLLNLSDSQTEARTGFNGFALLVHAASREEGERLFTALQEGGDVRMSLQPTPWSPSYGIICDRFGITWKVQS